MKERIATVVEELRLDQRILTCDEAATKQVVILRLLDVMGWNQYDVDQVTPEYPVEDGKVDYALRLANNNKVFVEVKRAGENLSGHQGQLLNYSFKHGVRLAVLTNGLTWWLYLPLREGDWEERRFYSIDILKQEASEIASRLIDFLSRENVRSGAAVEIAENLHESLQRGKIIDETLPRAWESLISGPDDLLVDLIDETVERLCGLKPGPEPIRRFLDEKAKLPPRSTRRDTSDGATSHVQPVSTLTPRSRVSVERPHIYKGKSPVSFTFADETFEVSTWKEILITVAENLYGRHATDYDRTLELRGTKRAYFSRQKQELREPIAVGNSGYFVETHFSANDMVLQCHRLMSLFGYAGQDLEIVFT